MESLIKPEMETMMEPSMGLMMEVMIKFLEQLELHKLLLSMVTKMTEYK